MKLPITAVAILLASNSVCFSQNSFPTPSGTVQINNVSSLNRLLVRPFLEATNENLVSLVTGQQRGLLVKDRENTTGGLWLFGAGSNTNLINSGAVGAGIVGDMATYLALTSSASAITFTNGNISFFANAGLTAGQPYWPSPKMFLSTTGSFGINTQAPGSVYKLAVAGKIAAWDEIKVFTNGTSFPDYVFAPDYKLRSLEETEKYIKENSHLPEVPSAAEIAKDGMSLNGMNEILLKKVEELTLYIIDQNKRIEALEQKVKH
ncbi:MAG: hypothetical protein ACKOE6_03780 [Flammeovirgaceae bacterium]